MKNTVSYCPYFSCGSGGGVGGHKSRLREKNAKSNSTAIGKETLKETLAI